MSNDRATVVITTKNRKDELCNAIRSVTGQTVPVEIIVMDDGSTDGTTELVRDKFPQVRLFRVEQSLGLIVQRNRAAALASAPILFSMDDDAEFSTRHVVEQTLRDFDNPRIGAVAVPYLEPKKGNRLMQFPPDTSGTWVTSSFIGTAHALLRDLFLRLGRYRESLFHQGEEGDFAVRLLEAGYVVRLGRSDSIRHWESPKRDFRRMDFFGRRNDILFAWHNVPNPYLPVQLIGTTINGLLFAVRCGRFWGMAKGVTKGYADCWRDRRARQPVTAGVYRLHRRLKKSGPLLLENIRPKLRPLESGLPTVSLQTAVT